jgi:hypothetical protein
MARRFEQNIGDESFGCPTVAYRFTGATRGPE